MATTKITSPELFDLGSLNTALKLPSGTTAERPTSPSTGEWRYNTTTNLVEFYDGGEWRDLQSEDIPPIPSENFSAVLYTGTGSTQSITGVGFQPDFVWIKNRDTTNWHLINDSSRGANNSIFTNSTQGNQINDANGYISSFDTDGFTVTSGNTVNGNGNNLVAWCWKANGGTTSSNTDGSITSTVQANTKAGFSIITWAGTGGVNTVGHGLNSAPELILIKGLSSAGDWQVYSSPTGNGNKLVINSFAAQSSTTRWNSTSPTSSVFTLNDSGLGTNLVAYAFQSVAQYSSIGTYTGNSSDNGPIVETGFEPAFLIIKNTSDVGSWFMYDNKRNTSNPRINYLLANATNVEASDMGGVDFLSNGFQIKDDHPDVNDTGDTYLYIAFAADPSAAPVLADSFTNKLYTGTGVNGLAVTGLGFKPSMVWIKNRGLVRDHNLADIIQGVSREITPNTSEAQENRSVTSFDSDGFTLDNASGNYNANGNNYVAWNWKANPTPTINTDGTIQSLVSANQASGFSIVKLTGTGSAATIGHGLSAVPEMIIVKHLNGVNDWWVYNKDLNGGTNPASYFLKLNTSDAEILNGSGSVFQGTSPTSSVFYGGTAITDTGREMIAYCFKSISGFSKIGSYTGNGSAGHAITGLGFQPNFILIKGITSADNWFIFDSARGDSVTLNANLNAAEYADTGVTSFDSDGFTLGSGAGENRNGDTYIYMAIKQNLTQYPIASGEMGYLAIAGGGGGGAGTYGNGGGGGAGGLRTTYGTASGGGASAETNLTLTSGTYTITVGAGGGNSSSGSNSTITGNASISTVGGGAAGYRNGPTVNAVSGGSGGGAVADGVSSFGNVRPGAAGTANEGFSGADSVNSTGVIYGGGGGGAASAAVGQNGGNALSVSITANNVLYAGGGGTAGKADNSETYMNPTGTVTGGAGTSQGNNSVGQSAQANTGSGGGGGHSSGAGASNGGSGGSGIVVLRMNTTDYSGVTTGSPTVTTRDGETILTYTGSGTYVHS